MKKERNLMDIFIHAAVNNSLRRLLLPAIRPLQKNMARGIEVRKAYLMMYWEKTGNDSYTMELSRMKSGYGRAYELPIGESYHNKLSSFISPSDSFFAAYPSVPLRSSFAPFDHH